MTGPTTRLLMVDDRTPVRRGLCAFFATEPTIEIVGEATNGAQAIELAASLQPDVILMDLLMPVMDGVEATSRILAADPGARILVLTSFGSDDRLLDAIRGGAAGCLLKDGPPEDLVQAVVRIATGGGVLAPAIASRLLPELPLAMRRTLAGLDAADRQLLELLAAGLSDHEIDDRLRTEDSCQRVASLLARLELHGRAEAMLLGAVAAAADRPQTDATSRRPADQGPPGGQ